MRLKLTILAEDGRILLGGAVSSAGDRAAAEAVAAAVPGVKEVIGRLDASGRPFARDGDPAARFSALR